MKKVFFVFFMAAMAMSVSACGRQAAMSDLVNDSYHYQNEALGFQVDLPKEFEYYQTQMMPGKDKKGADTADWTDLQILVPTNDATYPLVAGSYAVPVTVRVYEAGKYADQKGYEKLVEGTTRVYAVKLWDKIPTDWQKKWTKELGENIKKSLQVAKQ